MSCRFAFRVGAGAEFFAIVRDQKTKSYATGPVLRVKNGWLVSRGKQLMQIATGKWYAIEITAGLGSQATGTWDLMVTPAGQASRRFAKLPVGSPGWNRANWFGFGNNSKVSSACYLDNLKISGGLYSTVASSRAIY